MLVVIYISSINSNCKIDAAVGTFNLVTILQLPYKMLSKRIANFPFYKEDIYLN